MTSGVSLLDDMELFNRIATRITREHPEIDRIQAGKIVDQAVLFVAAAGRYPGMGLSPSEAVDLAWDAFILYTREYMDFCARVCGRYVHHTPNDKPGKEIRLPNGDPIRTPAETADVLRECGYWVLDELWPAEAKAANCTNCYSGDHVGKPPPSLC
jgi:hypothetical protein